jgi:hypothetical protein
MAKQPVIQIKGVMESEMQALIRHDDFLYCSETEGARCTLKGSFVITLEYGTGGTLVTKIDDVQELDISGLDRIRMGLLSHP